MLELTVGDLGGVLGFARPVVSASYVYYFRRWTKIVFIFFFANPNSKPTASFFRHENSP